MYFNIIQTVNVFVLKLSDTIWATRKRPGRRTSICCINVFSTRDTYEARKNMTLNLVGNWSICWYLCLCLYIHKNSCYKLYSLQHCVRYFPHIDVNINKTAHKLSCVTVLLLPAVLNVIKRFHGIQEGLEFIGKCPLISALQCSFIWRRYKNKLETIISIISLVSNNYIENIKKFCVLFTIIQYKIVILR
jgi:hypothetical protein